MKTICIQSIIIIFLLFIYSCTPSNDKSNNLEYRLLKLHYENNSGEKGLTTFEYDENGNICKAIWELLDGSRNSINYYSYDKNCTLIKKYREFSDSITSTELFKYDIDGNLISENFQRSDSVSGIAIYEYDNNGNLSKANCKGLKGWFFGEINYIYDDNGKKIKGDIIQKGQNTGIITYSYDDKNNLIKEHWEFKNNWSQTFTYEYEICTNNAPLLYTSSNVFILNNNNYRLIKENYDYSNENGGPSYYKYNDKGKLLNKLFKRSDNFTTKTTYLYDCNGRLTKSYRKYSNGLSAIFTYEFTKKRKLLKRTFKRSDGKFGSEYYEYDENSRLTKAVYNNFDSWLTGTITFEYNKNNSLQTGYFKSDKGYYANIIFDYDEMKNLVKIHWDFSFSKTQTYTFEYEKI